MSLLTLMLIIVAAGVLLWAVKRFAPMEPKLYSLLVLVVVLVIALLVLQAFGIFSALSGVQVPRVR